MKNVFTAIMLFCMATCYAEEAKPVVPAANGDAVRKNVQELGKLFGVEPAAATPAVNTPPAPQNTKTVADVMDKAIDKVTDVVGAMSQAISKVAPDVWRIMIKQQYAKAIGKILPWPGIALVVWILSRSFKKWRLRLIEAQSTDGEEYGFSCGCYYISLIVVGILSIIGIVQLAGAIQLLVNPEYYAIQDLLRMILNRGNPN